MRTVSAGWEVERGGGTFDVVLQAVLDEGALWDVEATMGGEAIQLTPEELERAAERLERELEDEHQYGEG